MLTYYLNWLEGLSFYKMVFTDVYRKEGREEELKKEQQRMDAGESIKEEDEEQEEESKVDDEQKPEKEPNALSDTEEDRLS